MLMLSLSYMVTHMPVKENEKGAQIHVLLGFLECSTDGSITQDSQVHFLLLKLGQ